MPLPNNNPPPKGLNRTVVPPEEKLEMVKDFLDCRLDAHHDYFLSRTVREMVFRKPRKSKRLSKMSVVTKKMLDSGLMRSVIKACKETNLRVLKTIRLRVSDFYSNGEFLHGLPGDVRLIVLFRDPRPVVNSLLLAPDDWRDRTMLEPEVICQNIVGDIRALSKTRKRGQAHVVKFEDLIRDKEKVVRDLFSFLRLPKLTEFALDSLRSHETRQEEPSLNSSELMSLALNRADRFQKEKLLNRRISYGTWRYYNTYRSPEYNPDAWKLTIPRKVLGRMENSTICREAIAALDRGV